MNKKISLGAAVTFMAIVMSITFVLTMLFSQRQFNQRIANVTEREGMYNKVQEINDKIRSSYLKADDIDEEKLKDALGQGLLYGLNDPYAVYMDKETFAADERSRDGKIVGIGIEASAKEEEYIRIQKVYADSPAEDAGLKAGDLIIKVDDRDVAVEGVSASIKAISGEPGSRVKLTVRNSENEEKTHDLQRKEIKDESISSRKIGNYTYIKISKFNGETPADFRQAVKAAQDDNSAGIIFDLRDNGGGTLDAAVEMLDLLLPKGVIVTQTDSKGKKTTIGESDANEVDLPMITLTNKDTASASELFVSALKDYDKAESVGATTYGKGVMQQTYKLNDGSAIRFTTAYFNPPKSDNFDGVGVEADYPVKVTKEQQEEMSTAEIDGNYEQRDKVDPQLQKAMDVLASKH